jgi:hypothetical protein
MFYRVGRKEWGMQSFADKGNGLTNENGLRNPGVLKNIVSIYRKNTANKSFIYRIGG